VFESRKEQRNTTEAFVKYSWYLMGGVTRRHPAFAALIVVVLSIGTAASTSMMAVLHTLSADPLPLAGGRIVHPQLDPSVIGRPKEIRLPDALMWVDAMNLLNAPLGRRKAVILEGQVTVVPEGEGSHPFFAKAAYTQSSFFQMFRASFRDGSAWDAEADGGAAHVVVVSRAFAEKVFGTPDVVGRTLRLEMTDFIVVGILGQWAPRPRFYDLAEGAFSAPEDVFLPLETARALHMSPNSSPECWGSGMPDLSNLERAPCTWVELWVELDSSAQRAEYRNFLEKYSLEQKALGRFQGPPRVALLDVTEWLSSKKVIPGSARLQTVIAYGFLLICVFNASGLLLIMFLRRKRELGLRRALGATKRDIFVQLIVEVSGVAIVSAASSSLLTWAVLTLIRLRPEAYYAYVQPDVEIILVGFGLSLLASALATLLPAWQAARASPFSMLKS
jgi:putative ABC transport system permease protein